MPADSLNRFNAKHKKNGFWIKYLNRYTNQTEKDSALYIGYELYDNGEEVVFFPSHKGTYTIEYTGPATSIGKPILLNGMVRLFDTNGKVSYESTYSEGSPVSLAAYDYDRKGVCIMKEMLDYKKQYENIYGTFYYELYGREDVLAKHGYFRKGKHGWSIYFDKL